MEVTGATFREAQRGPNKGVLSVKVPNTSRKVFVTAREIDEFEIANPSKSEMAKH